MAKKLLLLTAVVFLLSSAIVFAGSGAEQATAGGKWTKTLQLTHMGNGPVVKPAVEDVVTPYFRQQTGVNVTLRGYPPDMEASLVAQTLIASGDIPETIGRHIIPPNEEAVKLFVDKGLLWEFSEANLKKYMPRFVARVNKYGDFNLWLTQEKRYQGKNWAMSSAIAINAFSKLPKVVGEDSPFLVDQSADFGALYGIGLRDDILKQIYPTARNVKETQDLYLKNNGKVDPKTAYSDIPINNLDDLMVYLQKAKDLIDKQNLKVGADKMIPGIPWCTECTGGDTLGWSFTTFFGYVWNEPPWYVVDPEPKVFYAYSNDGMKGALKWANDAYNKGLIDPEVFVKKGDEAHADVLKGRYAVIHNWQTGAANQSAVDNKYPWRYRLMPALWPNNQLKGPYEDITNFPATYHTHSGLLITKTVKEADLPQVFNWVDFMMSEENDILHTWGPPQFYTGTGKDRRFKAEYKDVENQKVYNVAGGKDGTYYGFPYGQSGLDWAYINEESAAVSFFPNWEYPEEPRYVYPIKANATDDFQQRIWQLWAASVRKRINFYPMVGWSQQNDLLAIPDFARVRYLLFSKSAPEIANIIRGPAGTFEANWARLRKVQEDEGLQSALDQVSAKWKEIYEKYVKQYWDHNRK